AVAVLVAEHGDHDPAVGQAVDGVRGGQLGLGDHLLRLDHLVHFRGVRRRGVHDVNAAGEEPRDDEVAPGPLAVTARAGVPGEVGQLVAGGGHRQAVDGLAVGLRFRVEVDGGEVVGLADVGAGVGGNDVGQCFGRRFAGVGRGGEGTAICVVGARAAGA